MDLLARPDSENHPDQSDPGAPTNEPPSNMRTAILTSEKTKLASLTLQGAKEVPLPNFGNDYSDAYVHRGILPQSWVQNVGDVFRGYPKLQRLHELKAEQFEQHAAPAVGIRCKDSKIAGVLQSMKDQQMQFDVLMVHGCIEEFPLERLSSLPLDGLSSRPSLLFLWVPATKIGEGREMMEKWGFRKGEDIAYIVNSLESRHAPAVDSWESKDTVFRPTTWHCLMGLKGTVRRSTNVDLIHCNVDTDVLLETVDQRANVVPEEIYSVVENFTSMNRKIHILPVHSTADLPVRPRRGWVVVSPDVFSVGSLQPRHFRDRRPIPVSREIDLLRPQTPPLMR